MRHSETGTLHFARSERAVPTENCPCFDGGVKQGSLEETHASQGRTCVLLPVKFESRTFLIRAKSTDHCAIVQVLSHKHSWNLSPSLVKKYPVVSLLQMLKRSLELWSVAWQPSCLWLYHCPSTSRYDSQVINM